MAKMKRMSATMIAAAGLILPSGASQALSSVNIFWQGGGPTLVAPSVSSVIVADIVLVADAAGVNGFFISIEFDPSELQVISAKELAVVNLPGMGNQFSPLSTGTVIDNTLGLVKNFDLVAGPSAPGLISATRTLGSITFHVLGAVNDATDIDVVGSLQNVGIDAIVTSSFDDFKLVGANFGGASVVPEPTTAMLLFAGTAGLGYAGRGRLR